MRFKTFTLFILGLLVCISACTPAKAQQISVEAPQHVEMGENFKVAYTVNSQNVHEFKMPAIPGGLELIAGPYTSQMSSYSFTNGHSSSSSSITFTYIFYAAKRGNYTIGPAKAHMGGKVLASRALRISVGGSARNTGGAPQMHQESSAHRMSAAGTPISSKDLFIKVTASKRRVHEQEPILLTYKVYTTVDLTELNYKMPDLTGFHSQEVKLPQQKSFHIENLNGRPYRCVTWSQYVMYPQMTGKLTIPSITFKGIVVQQNRNVDAFEAMFNGGSDYVEVKKNIVAPGLTIQVDPLPAKPAGFSGGVGHFNISAHLSQQRVKAGDPVTLRVVVGGVGNLKLIRQPVVNFPKDFDKYDPKLTDKTKLTANGVEGNMVYDYMFVPRNQGNYTIPSVPLTYYDTSTNSYRTIHTGPLSLKVDKGSGSVNDVSDYSEHEPQDILPLHKGNNADYVPGSFFFGSLTYVLLIAVVLASFVALLIVFRKRALENANVVRLKGKRANKVATKRLKKARTLMFAAKPGEFYDEVLRALWGYVGDKLNMPVVELNRENIEAELRKHQIDDNTIANFIKALDECEYERYAPGDEAGSMSKTFECAVTAIVDIENRMNENKKHKHPGASVTALLLLLLLAVCPGRANAITRQNADAEYTKGNYQQAIEDYNELLQHGPSATIYYNLGNAYYRTDNLAKSILSYERALKYNPADNDARFNLQFVRSKTIDKITPQNEMFFVIAYKWLVNRASSNCWARWSVASLVLSLLLLLVYLFAGKLWMRKAGLFAGAAMQVLFLFTTLFAWNQKYWFNHQDGAIVMQSAVEAKTTPVTNGAQAFVLHEGSKVYIEDKTLKGWLQVTTDDGREGWIKTGTVEEI